MKKKIYPIVICLTAFLFSTKAQLTAITENGDSLVIFANGTWDYLENFRDGKDGLEDMEINESPFSKSPEAQQKVTGKTGMYNFHYDREKLKRLPPGQLNEDAEFTFLVKDEDAYVMIIYEKMNMPVETLSNIALSNLIEHAPNANIDLREWRTVNGKKMICQQISATVTGIELVYLSYFFTDERGSIQLHTFCGKSYFEELRSSLEEYLNGLEIL